jgi:hypothetical protein
MNSIESSLYIHSTKATDHDHDHDHDHDRDNKARRKRKAERINRIMYYKSDEENE